MNVFSFITKVSCFKIARLKSIIDILLHNVYHVTLNVMEICGSPRQWNYFSGIMLYVLIISGTIIMTQFS